MISLCVDKRIERPLPAVVNNHPCIINLFLGSIFPFCTSLHVEHLHKQGDTLELENRQDSCSF